MWRLLSSCYCRNKQIIGYSFFITEVITEQGGDRSGIHLSAATSTQPTVGVRVSECPTSPAISTELKWSRSPVEMRMCWNKSENTEDPLNPTSTNIIFMKTYNEEGSAQQFELRFKECVFPLVGSFNLRQPSKFKEGQRQSKGTR